MLALCSAALALPAIEKATNTALAVQEPFNMTAAAQKQLDQLMEKLKKSPLKKPEPVAPHSTTSDPHPSAAAGKITVIMKSKVPKKPEGALQLYHKIIENKVNAARMDFPEISKAAYFIDHSKKGKPFTITTIEEYKDEAALLHHYTRTGELIAKYTEIFKPKSLDIYTGIEVAYLEELLSDCKEIKGKWNIHNSKKMGFEVEYPGIKNEQ